MEAVALIIALLAIVALTAKLWSPVIEDKAEEANIELTRQKAERQFDYRELSERVDTIIKENGGIVYDLDSIVKRLHPTSTNPNPNSKDKND